MLRRLLALLTADQRMDIRHHLLALPMAVEAVGRERGEWKRDFSLQDD
jgi:hypothetical protein